jgi:hypothetical protein
LTKNRWNIISAEKKKQIITILNFEIMKTTALVNGTEYQVKGLINQDAFDIHTSYVDGKVIEMKNGAVYILDENDRCVYFVPKKYIFCNLHVKVGYQIIVECVKEFSCGRRIARSLVYVSDLMKEQVYSTNV